MRPAVRVGLGLGLATALALAPVGCSWRRAAYQLGFGSFLEGMRVVGATPRAGYLDVELSGPDLYLRSFVRDDATCRFVFKGEAIVAYSERGVGGRFRREEVECDAVGISEPSIRRARQPRGTGGSLVPRAQASFRILHEDADVLMLRGRFPLAARVGWAGGFDTVAVVPTTPECRAAARSGVASMEFRPAGRRTLTLLADGQHCPIIGFALPLDGG